MEINTEITTTENEEIQQVRRAKLKSIIDRSFFSVTALADSIKINRANISALLSGARSFTTPMSNRIESALALPQGYLSVDDDIEFNYSSYIDVAYYENINDINNFFKSSKLKFPKALLLDKALGKQSELVIVRMPDDLMSDTINKGDVVIIDTANRTVEDGSIYLYEYLDILKIRRIQIIAKNTYQINYDNTKLKLSTTTFNSKELKIIGKIVNILKVI